MHLLDIRERTGAYWAAYQAERAREHIADNPDYVPDWFVAKLARERVAAARVALEQLGAEPMDVFGSSHQRELTAVWSALRIVEQFIREGGTTEPAIAQVVAGLLGAQEIETERERHDYREGPYGDNLTLRPEVRERQQQEFLDLEKRYLRAQGYLDAASLARAQAEQVSSVGRRHATQWAALVEIEREAATP